jgi:hypothetical protein
VLIGSAKAQGLTFRNPKKLKIRATYTPWSIGKLLGTKLLLGGIALFPLLVA